MISITNSSDITHSEDKAKDQIIFSHTFTLSDGMKISTTLTYNSKDIGDIEKFKLTLLPTINKTVEISIAYGLGAKSDNFIFEGNKFSRFKNGNKVKFKESEEKTLEYKTEKDLNDFLIAKKKKLETAPPEKADKKERLRLIDNLGTFIQKNVQSPSNKQAPPPVEKQAPPTKKVTHKPNTSKKLSNLAKRTDHIGSGVLPYYISNDGTAYLLLSKEAGGGGKSQGTWCDFGGKRDKGETAVKTAAREGWEESRDLLGTQKEIESKISINDPIFNRTQNPYATFFLKVDNPQNVTNKNFKAKKFSDWTRMEKSEIAWVKAKDVFNAVVASRNSSNHNKIEINGKTELLRGCFAGSLSHALKQEKELLEGILGSQNLV